MIRYINKPLPVGTGADNDYLVQMNGPPATSYLGWGGILVGGSIRSSQPGTFLTDDNALVTDVYGGYNPNGSAVLNPLIKG